MELGLSALTSVSDLLGIIILNVITPRITAHEKVPVKMLKKMYGAYFAVIWFLCFYTI